MALPRFTPSDLEKLSRQGEEAVELLSALAVLAKALGKEGEKLKVATPAATPTKTETQRRLIHVDRYKQAARELCQQHGGSFSVAHLMQYAEASADMKGLPLTAAQSAVKRLVGIGFTERDLSIKKKEAFYKLKP